MTTDAQGTDETMIIYDQWTIDKEFLLKFVKDLCEATIEGMTGEVVDLDKEGKL